MTKNTTMVTTRTIGINCTRRIAAYLSIAESSDQHRLEPHGVTENNHCRPGEPQRIGTAPKKN